MEKYNRVMIVICGLLIVTISFALFMEDNWSFVISFLNDINLHMP